MRKGRTVFTRGNIPKNFRDYLSKMPLQTIADRIEYIRSTNRFLIDGDVARLRIDEVMQGYTWMTQVFKAPRAYRGRLNIGGSMFYNVKEVWYPPKSAVSKMGRLNDRFVSLFYCADSEATAIFECRPEIGQRVTVIECVAVNPEATMHVHEVAIKEIVPWVSPGPTIHEMPVSRLLFGRDDNDKKNKLIRQLFVDEFTRLVPQGHDHEYIFSVAIAEKMLAPDEIDGIAYPSIMSSSNANLAIKQHAADRVFRCSRAWVVEVLERLDNGKLKVRCIATSNVVDVDGTFRW